MPFTTLIQVSELQALQASGAPVLVMDCSFDLTDLQAGRAQYLSGHLPGNRLEVFARQAAPLQVSWLGYPDSSGLSRMHWRLTDAIIDAFDAYTTMSKQALDSERVRSGLKAILLGPAQLYEVLRERGGNRFNAQ